MIITISNLEEIYKGLLEPYKYISSLENTYTGIFVYKHTQKI